MRVTAAHVQGSRPWAQAIAGASQADRGWKKVPCPRPRRQGNLPDSRAGTPPANIGSQETPMVSLVSYRDNKRPVT